MSDTIPDAVIEAMLAEGPGDPYLDHHVLNKMCAAAEKLGWRLCPREPTTAMRCHSTFEASERWWPMMWDAAPKVRG